MEDLKTMLDKGMSIADINKAVNQFINSAEGYKDTDKLKLTFVLLNLIQEETSVLRTISVNDFTKQVNERINEVKKEHKSFSDMCGAHMTQNDSVIDVLCRNKDNRMSILQEEIQELLSEYDGILNELVEDRRNMALSEILKQ